MPSVRRKPTSHAGNRATPSASSPADPAIQGVVRHRHGLLQSSRNQDDPEQEPVVPVPEGDERELVAASRRRFLDCALDVALVPEIRPPECSSERKCEQNDEDEIGVELHPGGAAPMPITTTDSPSAMMITSPWRSTKCVGETKKPSTLVSHGTTAQNRSAAAIHI